ncbi:hypothetical protein RXV86_02510 [Alisedimentitalea sp. MJ-SS2]|uniref:hypothetical protein n=1 Tax=Aliisedimentitalea sp. MJ-SS2 TaxID=3049795 RepID=UPI00290FC982|nr:hypothetical protein [Alisedimentitalea sp. MJ-SS2]MDU8926247.1 hypothetical protein [Alisedimentitalea sp. MJ-SS2]
MKRISLTFALTAALACPTASLADPAFGFGITILSNGDTAVGLRVFSNNRRNKPAASLGIDYKFETQSFRPAIGAAYLDHNIYVDATVGFDLQTNTLDFGVGTGMLWNSRAPFVPTIPTQNPTPPPPPTGNTDS